MSIVTSSSVVESVKPVPFLIPLSLNEGFVSEAIKERVSVRTPALDSVIVDAGDVFVTVISVEVSTISKRAFSETKPFVEKSGFVEEFSNDTPKIAEFSIETCGVLIVMSRSFEARVTPVPFLIPLVWKLVDDSMESPPSVTEVRVWELLIVISVSAASNTMPPPFLIPLVWKLGVDESAVSIDKPPSLTSVIVIVF